MKPEKIYHSKLVAGTLLGSLLSLEWITGKLGPRLAKRPGVGKIEQNRTIQSWDKHPIEIDLYTPKGVAPAGGWPVALMIHGGGFRFFSKDSHAPIAARIAETGYLTIATNYRLAPKHPYPHGLIDVLSVYDWIHAHARDLGGNPDHMIVAGESAGANFALGICLLSTGLSTLRDLGETEFASRPLKWTVPKKALLHCGYHQVSNVARLDSKVGNLVRSRVRMIQRNYLPKSLDEAFAAQTWGLADPLVILENLRATGGTLPAHFPEVFIPVGERDPVLDDSERLGKVFDDLKGHSQLKVYPNAPHSFYAMPWHAQYNQVWNDIVQFLK